MKIDLRGKLFLLSLLIDILILLLVGVYLENRLHARLEQNITQQLHHNAETARIVLERVLQDFNVETIDPWADAMGDAMGERLTILAPDGVVVGDSALSLQEIARLDNHLLRKEVQKALSSSEGVSRRYSDTLGEPLLYLARPFDLSAGRGVVRVSTSMQEVHHAVGQMRMALITGGILALLPGVAITGVMASILTRRLRELVRRTRKMTEALAPEPGFPESTDEISGLAWSIERMASNQERLFHELSHDRHRMEVVLQSLSEGVLTLDLDRRVILINDSAMALLELPSPAPVGRPVEELIPPEYMERLFQGHNNRGICTVEEEIITGRQNCLQVCGTFLKESGNCVLVLRDVTQRRRAEKAQQDFVANVAHELRSPVHAILVHAELLTGRLTPPHQDITAHAMATSLERNAVRLSRIIDDVLYLSKLDADKEVLEMESLTLLDSVTPILEVLEKDVREKALQIEVKIAPWLRVQADPRMLDKVVFNLLDNAVKYAPSRTRIVLEARRVERELRVEVMDNGLGVPLESRSRLFERFFRVDGGRSRKTGGTGLGLAIVKHLVEKMNGNVGMEPVLPQGALFWFTLRQVDADNG